jgi:hypothetical protein
MKALVSSAPGARFEPGRGRWPARRRAFWPALRRRPLGALAVFVVVGVVTHDHGLVPAALARVGLPLLVAWLLATAIVGTYRRCGVRTLVAAWAIAVPPAAAIRTAVAGGPWGDEFVVFLAVALFFAARGFDLFGSRGPNEAGHRP